MSGAVATIVNEEDECRIIGEANPKQREVLLSAAYRVTRHFDPDVIGQSIMEMCGAMKRAKAQTADGSWKWGPEEPDHYQRAIGLKLAQDWMKHTTEHTVGRAVERKHIVVSSAETPEQKASKITNSPAAIAVLLEELIGAPGGKEALTDALKSLTSPSPGS